MIPGQSPKTKGRQWEVSSHIPRRMAMCILSGGILLFILGPGFLLALQKKPKPGKASPPAAKTQPAREQPAAFRAGEQLDYRVLWSSFAVNAANIQLSVMERRPFYGTEAWHFQAQARTVETTRLVFQVDDQFDSYSAPGDLVSLQYEMYLHEQGKSESSVLRMSSAPTPAPSPVAQARVLPGTRDPLGFLYYLRQVDWTRTPETRSPVFDGRKLYEVRARLDTPRSNVNVPAGKFSASRIEVRVFEGGKQEPMATFGVWLALDGGRTPVLIEAEVPFGTARVELTRAASRNQAAKP